jgi:hypothetical protein
MAKKLVKRQALDEYANLFVKTLKEQLINNKPFSKKASGRLVESINIKIDDTQDGETITIFAEDYLKFVDQGVSGTIRKYNTPYSYRNKKPPISVILQWTRLKGIPQEAAYPIQNKIFRFGIKPTNVIDKTFREIQYRSKWINKFEEEITSDIIDMFKKTLGKQ